MSNPSVVLSGHSGHAIAELIENREHDIPVRLARGAGRRARKRVSSPQSSQGFRAVALDLRGHGAGDRSNATGRAIPAFQPRIQGPEGQGCA